MTENNKINGNKEEEIKKTAEDVEKKEEPILEEEVTEDPFQKLKKERNELLDKYLRALANYENLRKRIQKEKESIYNFGIERVFREILPVIDDLGRAFNSLENEDEEDKQDVFIKGIRLIYSKLTNILKTHLVEPFDSIGEKFDSSRHEAVHVVESNEEEGIILEEVEKGYLIKDKVLRPARVIVAKEKEEVEETKNKEEIIDKNKDNQSEEVENNERTSNRD